MYSFEFEKSLIELKKNISPTLKLFLINANIFENNQNKIFISALANLFCEEKIPSLKNPVVSIYKLIFILVASGVIGFMLLVAGFIMNLYFIKGIRLKKKKDSSVIFWTDTSPSSLRSFGFLHENYPKSDLINIYSFNSKMKVKNKFQGEIFYFHVNGQSVFNIIKFNIFYVKGLVKSIGTNYSILGLINFILEFQKSILSAQKCIELLEKYPEIINRVSIFSHEVSPFFSTFISILNYYKAATVTVIHGGCFFPNNIHLIPAYSKYILAPSQREMQYFDQIKNNNSFALGIPLQQIVNRQFIITKKDYYEYDFLILATIGAAWEKNLIFPFLDSISKALVINGGKTLLRIHPYSNSKTKNQVLKKLGNINFDVSINSSLENDLARSKIILSFSVDSTITSVLNRKNTILFVFPDCSIPEDLNTAFPYFKIVRSDSELIKALYSLINKSSLPIIDDDDIDRKFVKYFGEYKIEQISNNASSSITHIISKEYGQS